MSVSAQRIQLHMKINRIWAMPNRWTFTIKPIVSLLQDEGAQGLMKQGVWYDPFAGKNSPADFTNDINPEANATDHMDALDWLQKQETGSADGVLYDPPYSFRQASECYKGFGKTSFVTSKEYWSKCKDEVARIIKPGGKCIGFGWNSNGLGINRGFEMTKVLLVPHGGSMNDTICTVEVKL